MNIYDCIGVGFGPENIALAATFEEVFGHLNPIFLERRNSFVWQEEMLFENALNLHSDIQNIPHRDLATPRDPRSRYTFLNYLHENGRFFAHLNMDLQMPLRPEFAKYIEWCAEELSGKTRRGADIVSIKHVADLNVLHLSARNGEMWQTRNLVLGHGREPNIPDVFKPMLGEQIFHFSKYKSQIAKLYAQGARKVAIIGSSQTAAELLLHITEVYPDMDVHIIMRHFGFPLKDTSPFMSEIYFPEFTEFYFSASPEIKKRIDKDVYRTNYGAADMDVIAEVYRQIYHDDLHGTNKIVLQRVCDIDTVSKNDSKVSLTIKNHLKRATLTEDYDAVVLATGFQNYGEGIGDISLPPMLSEVAHLLALKDHSIDVTDFYELRTNERTNCKIFLNGLSERFHGMGDAGSLSLASLRALKIAKLVDKNSIKESEFYHAS